MDSINKYGEAVGELVLEFAVVVRVIVITKSWRSSVKRAGYSTRVDEYGLTSEKTISRSVENHYVGSIFVDIWSSLCWV